MIQSVTKMYMGKVGSKKDVVKVDVLATDIDGQLFESTVRLRVDNHNRLVLECDAGGLILKLNVPNSVIVEVE